MKRKKLKIDFNKVQISAEVKDFILEQSDVIEKLNTQLKELVEENKELKKNFN